MKFLLVHPNDLPDSGPWGGETWDRVIDLGRGGAGTYERWTRHFHCPASPIDSVCPGTDKSRPVQEAFAMGAGRLQDAENLDWWELIAMFYHQQIETLGVLRRFVRNLEAVDVVFVTRRDFYSDALQLLLGNRLRYFPARSAFEATGMRRYFGVVSQLPLAQLLEIAGDKFDAAYSLRGLVSRKPKRSSEPVVLLPSAYVNVSRMGIAYAETIPETNFLLVATRRSAQLAPRPANVAVRRLASYAGRVTATRRECEDLLEQWRVQRPHLESVPEIAMLGRVGLLDAVPKLLRQGLGIRDAWRNVLDTEPVQAVLCADDSNPYTHLPLMLAAQRGIPTIACHHGALDGRHLFKQNHADVILAKGKMEEDYLLKVCRLPAQKVETGAPVRSGSLLRTSPTEKTEREAASSIVFFSEPYEVCGGRCGEFYRDILPALADVAHTTGRKLIVKLHPFESARQRKSLLSRLLTSRQLAVTTMMSGTFTPDLLHQTWFGVTVLSTMAVECALQGIPCFLCGWMEYSSYGYLQQFGRFGVGYLLHSPAEIPEIPRILATYVAQPVLRDLWQPIVPDRLRELLSASKNRDRAIAV